MTKKDFVLAVTEEIQKQPRIALSGHGLNGQMLGIIASRPDIIAKLVQFITNTKHFRKGKNALKKAGGFKITAYRNFNDFNKRGASDVAKFKETLDPKELEKFTDNGNVITMLCLTEKVVDEVNLANEIANGKSQFIPYEKAVTSQYKLPNGFYITIMYTPDLILTKAQALADRQNAKNTKIVERNTKVAKVKSEFVKKNKAKLANLNKEVASLETAKEIASTTQQHLANSLQEFGIASGKVADIRAGKKAHDERIKDELLKLSERDNANLQQARQLWRGGFEKEAKTVARRIKNGDKKVVLDYIMNDGMIDSKSKIKAKKMAIQNSIKATDKQLKEARKTAKNEQTPLAKKKAQAEVERLKRVKEIELKKLENAKRLEENKSLNVKSAIDSITNKIDRLTKEGTSLQDATRKAVQEIEGIETNNLQLLQKIKRGYQQQLVQQKLTTPEQITPVIAQQILQQVVQDSVIQQVVEKPIKGRKKTPLMIKKEQAERAVLAQQIADLPVTVGGVVENIVDTVADKVITTAKSSVNKVVNKVADVAKSATKRGRKKTPLIIKKEQAEKARLAKQIVANQESKMQTKGAKNITEKMKKASVKTAKQVKANQQKASSTVSKSAEDRAKLRAESFQDIRKREIKEAKETKQPSQKFEMELMGNGSLRDKVLGFI